MTLGKLEDYWEVPFLSPSEGLGRVSTAEGLTSGFQV